MNLEDIYRLLRHEHVQAQGIVDTLPQPLLVLGDTLRVESASRAFYRMFNVSADDTIGVPVYELGSGQWDNLDLKTLLEQVIPRSAAVVDYEVAYEFPGIGQRTMLLNACHLNPEGSARTILLTIEDVTAGRRRQEEADVLLAELRHRIGNLLGLVHALATQTTAQGRSGEEYRDTFLKRLTALSNATEVTTDARNAPIALGKVVEGAMAPFTLDGNAIVIEPGPAVQLAEAQVLPLSLIMHELATNAVKYGALSQPGGCVKVTWKVRDADTASGNRRMQLYWNESGGPPTRPPAAQGFGSRLIQFAAAHELGGEANLAFDREGLKAEISIPLS